MYSQHWRSFLPAFHRQRPFGLVKEEGTPRLQSGGASTGFGYNSDLECLAVCPRLGRSPRGIDHGITAPVNLSERHYDRFGHLNVEPSRHPKNYPLDGEGTEQVEGR
jgi:hypothetical protein